ncbi:MAG: hypothetical protein CVV03_02605 [Firmicutes bacterium HGW-Firmicutes-8]|nr:MAG: hypothetical protein CVV03_02605 [Firmicutes bacterium HGW-Firmicutes-8]
MSRNRNKNKLFEKLALQSDKEHSYKRILKSRDPSIDVTARERLDLGFTDYSPTDEEMNQTDEICTSKAPFFYKIIDYIKNHKAGTIIVGIVTTVILFLPCLSVKELLMLRDRLHVC